MTTKFSYLLGATAVMAAVTLFAQEGSTKAGGGTLMLNNKTFQLAHALAYETMIGDEEAVVVLLSGQPVSSETLNKAREAEKEGGDGDFKKPFLKLIFSKTGELKHWGALAGGTTVSNHSGSEAKAELKVADGRAMGKASERSPADAMIPSSFDVRFDVALVKAGEKLPASAAKKGGPAANVKPTVTGIFKGDGKDAKLAYVSARWGEPFNGKPGIVLVFTEKDHSTDKKPDTSAMFGNFGNALVVSLHEDGDIYGCEVMHDAMKRKGFSSVGKIETSAFNYGDGKVEGELTTNGETDFFDENWEVKLKFVAPLGEIPKELQVAEPTTEETRGTAMKPSTSEEADEETDSKLAADAPKAKELALTKDAAAIQYNSMMESLQFESKAAVKSVCAELAANLKAQGWSNDGPDLVQPQSSILKRKRGKATLTIFVKPMNEGSEVKMMTEGLSWE